MTPYFFLLVLVMFIAVTAGRSRDKTIRRSSLFLTALILALFSGLRDDSVGTDTLNYTRLFKSGLATTEIFNPSEVAFQALAEFSIWLSPSYTIFLSLIAFIVIFFYFVGIVRLEKRFAIPLFLFITLGVYTFSFNGARQGIAAAICFSALPYLLERRPIQFFSLVFFASLFHVTALINLILWLAVRKRNSPVYLCLIAIFVGIISYFIDNLVSFASATLSDRFAIYAIEGDGGGFIVSSFLVSQGLLLTLLRRRASDPLGNYDKLLSIYLFGLIPVLVSGLTSVDPSGILRLRIYFESTAMVLWPMVIFGIEKPSLRPPLLVTFILFFMMYFFLTTEGLNGLNPYLLRRGLF